MTGHPAVRVFALEYPQISPYLARIWQFTSLFRESGTLSPYGAAIERGR